MNENTEQKAVDVLHAIDQAELVLGVAGLKEGNIFRRELREARAAVEGALSAAAALADAVDAETAHLASFKFATIAEADQAKGFENRVVECSQALRAALARCGGVE